MGFFSRYFSFALSHGKNVRRLEQLIKNLTQDNDMCKERLDLQQQKIDNLKKSCDTYKERIQQSINKNKTLHEQQLAHSVNNRRGLTLERVDHFFTGKKLSLPQESYDKFLKKCADSSPENYTGFVKNLDKLQHRGFYEQLFSVEIDMSHGFDFNNLRPIIAFQRGSYDIEIAKNKGITIDELKEKLITKTKSRFDQFLDADFIDPGRVDAVCEIGAAWGAATRYMLNRYKPSTYHVYEIDTAWAQWLADNLGVDSKSCDGESLSDTKDESMDIVVASSCLYFMPFVKQWNYLTEMARVLKPGGIALFNVNIIERTTIRTLKGLLSNFFPRRSFGYIPQHCLDTAFPEKDFEILIEDPSKYEHYHIYRKR